MKAEAARRRVSRPLAEADIKDVPGRTRRRDQEMVDVGLVGPVPLAAWPSAVDFHRLGYPGRSPSLFLGIINQGLGHLLDQVECLRV